MGNRSCLGLPQVPHNSNEEWVVLHVQRKNFMEVVVNYNVSADQRLVERGVQAHDYKQKLNDFNGKLNKTIRPPLFILVLAILLCVLLNVVDLVDASVSMALEVFLLVGAFAYMLYILKSLPGVVDGVFADWKKLGITGEGG